MGNVSLVAVVKRVDDLSVVNRSFWALWFAAGRLHSTVVIFIKRTTGQFWVDFTPHIFNIRKLKANFCGREKEGHFHYKNFLRALKWVPTWYTYTVGTKSLLSDWLPFTESQSERSILCLPCRYVMRVLILKLSKSFYNESESVKLCLSSKGAQEVNY